MREYKTSAIAQRRILFAKACEANGLDLTKDFYSLSFSDISTLDDIRRSFKFSGKNYIGRSRCRQFWLACKRGYETMQNA